jgi:hypothetical protein
MKGAVKTNIPPPTGHRKGNPPGMAASPASVETICCFRLGQDPSFIMASRGPQKLKSVWRRGCVLPTTVLFESQGLLLFQVMRGGIELVWVFDRGRGPISPRILTLDLSVPTTPTTSGELSSCRQTVRNGYVVQFSFWGSNVSPFFQILRATAAILRASVSRAISLRMPFCSNACR